MVLEFEPWQEFLIILAGIVFGGLGVHTLKESECSTKAGDYKFTFKAVQRDANHNGIDDDLEMATPSAPAGNELCSSTASRSSI